MASPFDQADHAATGAPWEDDGRAGDPDVQRMRRPNYVIRRVIVFGGVAAVLVGAGLLVANVRSNSSASTDNGSIRPDWNRIVLVDSVGALTIAEPDGSEIGEIDTDIGRLSTFGVVDATALVVGAERVAVVDVTGDEPADAVAFADADLVNPTGSELTMIAAAADGSRGLVVHGPTGESIDTDTYSPIVGARYEWFSARSDPSGRHVLVTDTSNFQSVLLSMDRDEPTFVPGLALAVDDGTIVTAQNVGEDATVSVFDHDGEAISTARTSPVRAALIGDAIILAVTIEGEIVSINRSTGSSESVGALDIGPIASGAVTTTGSQLVVVGETGTAIVDADGSIVASLPGRPIDTRWATQRSSCTTMVGGAEATVFSLGDGAEQGQGVLDDPVANATADGCTVATPTDGAITLFGAQTATIETSGDLVAFAPDGAAFVVEAGGRLLLVPVGGDATIELGSGGRLATFTGL
jgi:hypothetical protein